MPRLTRLPSIPFGWYYVALHSVANRTIVTNRTELAKVLELLRRALRGRGARLHAGYVAEREIHLVLQAGEGPLSAITGSFQHDYARHFNRGHDGRGSLFRPHHHVLLFQHQRWLVPLVHFVHWLPRAEVRGDHAAALYWSSDAAYSESGKHHWVTTNVVLRMLSRGAPDRRSREEAYRRVFDRAPQPDHLALFRHGSPEDPRLLGDAQFIADVGRGTGRRPPDRGRRTLNPDTDIQTVMMRIVERFQALCDQRLSRRQAAAWRRLLTYENVRSKSRRRPLPMLRALTVSYLVEHRLASQVQAARFFGCAPRSLSARRRRYYQVFFREAFGATPEALLAHDDSPYDDHGYENHPAPPHAQKFLGSGCDRPQSEAPGNEKQKKAWL